MKRSIALAFLFLGTGRALAQGAPDIVWQIPTPNTLANSVMAVGWSPTEENVAVGSTDRWLRLRGTDDGDQAYSVLEPPRQSGVGQILYSIDGGLIGVNMRGSGMTFIVQRASDGVSLGKIVGSVGNDGLVTFAPDATLLANTGGDGTLSRWRFADLTVFRVTGSGYDTVSTAFNFSPDGALQTAASEGTITVRRRSDGAVVRTFNGGSLNRFSPNSGLLATWSATPSNQILLWRTSDWTLLRSLPSSDQMEKVSALRFTSDGSRLASTGYLPYLDTEGLWQQKGIIRFWSVSDGAVIRTYDQQTDIAVTSPVALSADGTRFAYGLYNGTVAVALTPGCSSLVDSDHDGEGDLCDLDDGLLVFLQMERGGLGWQPDTVYSAFNLYRGSLARLRATGEYTQDPLVEPEAGRWCHTSSSYQADAHLPPRGDADFYLVTGVSGTVESSLGDRSDGTQRLNTRPCP